MSLIKEQKPSKTGAPPDLSQDFFAGVMVMPDQDQAVEMVTTQAHLTYNMDYGAQIMQMERELAEERITHDHARQAMTQQENQLAATNPTIKTAQARNEQSQNKQSLFRFMIWLKDFVIGSVMLLLGIAVVLMGAANIYSIIMASGTPVFLEEPRLAMMLSGLLPIGSVALKFFSNVLPHDRSKKRYTFTLYGATAASLLAWVILFGLTFGSAASGLDWDNLDMSGGAGKGAAFTVIQLLAELLVGATLFQVAGDIWATYAPMTTAPNPVYEDLQKNLEALRIPHAKRTQELSAKEAHLHTLKNGRDAYTNAQILIYRREAARIYGAPVLSSKSSNNKKEKKPMKSLLTLMVAAMMLFGFQGSANAKTLMIGVSPMMSQNEIHSETLTTFRFLGKVLKAGDRAEIYDALNIRHLGTFIMPEDKNYHTPKALLNYNSAVIGVLRDRTPATQEQIAQSVKGAIKMPQFLRFLSQNHMPFDDATVIILGSPIYVDHSIPEWDMRGGSWFSDGHFRQEPQSSVFATLRQKDWLKNVKVYIGFPDEDWAVNESYGRVVLRMYTLFIETQGGMLCAFTSDMKTLFDRALNHAGALPHDFKVDMTDKPGTFSMIAREDRH